MIYLKKLGCIPRPHPGTPGYAQPVAQPPPPPPGASSTGGGYAQPTASPPPGAGYAQPTASPPPSNPFMETGETAPHGSLVEHSSSLFERFAGLFAGGPRPSSSPTTTEEDSHSTTTVPAASWRSSQQLLHTAAPDSPTSFVEQHRTGRMRHYIRTDFFIDLNETATAVEVQAVMRRNHTADDLANATNAQFLQHMPAFLAHPLFSVMLLDPVSILKVGRRRKS